MYNILRIDGLSEINGRKMYYLLDMDNGGIVKVDGRYIKNIDPEVAEDYVNLDYTHIGSALLWKSTIGYIQNEIFVRCREGIDIAVWYKGAGLIIPFVLELHIVSLYPIRICNGFGRILAIPPIPITYADFMRKVCLS